MPRLRIYSETLPFAEVTRPRTLGLLARYDLEIVLAVRPWQLGDLPDVARALRDAGIPLSVWPMLADDDGRWASAHNAERFVAFARDVCDTLDAASVATRDVLFDLEPPFSHAKSLADGHAAKAVLRVGKARSSRGAFASAEVHLGALVRELDARGVATSSAVWPLVALDPPAGRGWQTALGTPVDALAPGHVSVMMYTSILEGWSRGALRRRDVASLLSAATARVVRRWGDRGGISLGCVGTGAFADEPTYRGPAELAEDAALARAAGCDRLALFDLGGVLSRGPAEAWLDAFTIEADAGNAIADRGPSKRVRAARRLAHGVTWALRRRS